MFILPTLQFSNLSTSHSDLKSLNLLVTKDFVVKVADFGSASVLSHSRSNHVHVDSAINVFDSHNARLLTRNVGTLLWQSPEIIQNQPCNRFLMRVGIDLQLTFLFM